MHPHRPVKLALTGIGLIFVTRFWLVMMMIICYAGTFKLENKYYMVENVKNAKKLKRLNS